jgi:hypothetical protein
MSPLILVDVMWLTAQTSHAHGNEGNHGSGSGSGSGSYNSGGSSTLVDSLESKNYEDEHFEEAGVDYDAGEGGEEEYAA